MTKSVIMKNAWTIAKEGATKFGGKVVEYFAEALKEAWKLAKEFAAQKKAKQQAKKVDADKLQGMMTSKQEWFITKLGKELEGMGIDPLTVEGFAEAIEGGIYATTKREASLTIEALLQAKKAA